MKMGTIGTGQIVDDFIESAFLVNGLVVEACYSRDLLRAQEFASKHQLPKYFDQIDSMLEHVDLVYIASPNSLHFEQAVQVIKAKKHVIIEKPFTGSLEQAIKIKELALEYGVYVFEAITTIYLPHFKFIKENLHKIGKVRAVQANFSQYSSRYDLLKQGIVTNVFDPKFNGGALSDLNIYNIHFVVGLFGKPSMIDYIANIEEFGIDTSGIVTMKYAGFVVECLGAKDSFSKNFIQIQGEAGYLYIDGAAGTLNNVSLVTQDDKILINQQEMSRLYYQIDNFVDIILNHRFDVMMEWLSHSILVADLAQQARFHVGLENVNERK